jgi:hypothetical protein
MQVVKNVLTDASDAAAPAAFMHFMSWLASQFAHVVKSTRQASLQETSQVHQQQQQSSLSATAAVPLSADFYFFATLLQPLLSHLQHLDANLTSNGAGVDLQMEGTGVHMEAGGSQTAASKRRKQVEGNKKEVKKTNGVPVAWHIAAEGAALLVWDKAKALIFCSHHFKFGLYSSSPGPSQDQMLAACHVAASMYLSVTTAEGVCPCLMSPQCVLVPSENCTGELTASPDFSYFQEPDRS